MVVVVLMFLCINKWGCYSSLQSVFFYSSAQKHHTLSPTLSFKKSCHVSLPFSPLRRFFIPFSREEYHKKKFTVIAIQPNNFYFLPCTLSQGKYCNSARFYWSALSSLSFFSSLCLLDLHKQAVFTRENRYLSIYLFIPKRETARAHLPTTTLLA